MRQGESEVATYPLRCFEQGMCSHLAVQPSRPRWSISPKTSVTAPASSGVYTFLGSDMQRPHLCGGVWFLEGCFTLDGLHSSRWDSDSSLRMLFDPLGGVCHDAPRGMCHRCHTNVSHSNFFIGRLHRFIGSDMQRHCVWRCLVSVRSCTHGGLYDSRWIS